MTAIWFVSLAMIFFCFGIALGKVSGRGAARGLKLEMEDLRRRMRTVERRLTPHERGWRGFRDRADLTGVSAERASVERDSQVDPYGQFLDNEVGAEFTDAGSEFDARDYGLEIRPQLAGLDEHLFVHGFARALTANEHHLPVSYETGFGMDSIRTGCLPEENDVLQRSGACEGREPDVTLERGSGEVLTGKGHPWNRLEELEKAGWGIIGAQRVTSRRQPDREFYIYKTLTWILRGGLALGIAVNLIAVASAFLTSGGGLGGMREVSSWYSPLNVSTWTGELAMFSPAWGAYLLREGWRQTWDAGQVNVHGQ
jgi:hypothetical protein